MIDRPKKSVTRFFVPLIDVLILLFCIFLLMPFFSEPTSAESPDNSAATPGKETTQPLPQDVQTLQKDLQQARRDMKDLQDFRFHLADRLNVLVLEIDPKNGGLYYYRERERIDIPDQRTAEDAIDRHKRKSGTKEPFFLILKPRGDGPGFPLRGQVEAYKLWFKDVQHRLDGP